MIALKNRFRFILAMWALALLTLAGTSCGGAGELPDGSQTQETPQVETAPPAQAVETSTITAPLPSAADVALSQTDTLLSLYSVDRQFGDVVELASDSYQGRKTGSDGASAAAAYVSSQFAALGLDPWWELGLDSYRHPFTLGGLPDDNVIGIIPGTEGSGYVMLAAHYDHLGVDSGGQVYNGADDNAAGVAALLEAARIIQQSEMRPARTIVLSAFSGEEQGQFGSQALGGLIASYGLTDSVEMINIDGIGATGGSYFGVWDEGESFSAPLVSALSLAGGHLGIEVREEGTDIGSDAQSFAWQFGIPAVTVDWHWGQDESAFHPYYHTVYDDPEHISLAALGQATKVAITGLWLRASGI